MPNLIQRITGDLDPPDIEDKIGLHAFLGALNEYKRGKVTGLEIVAAFSLTAAQTTQAETLKDLIAAAPNSTEFMRVFKDLMYMGETGLHPRYRNIVQVQARLEEEVTDQGGALP